MQCWSRFCCSLEFVPGPKSSERSVELACSDMTCIISHTGLGGDTPDESGVLVVGSNSALSLLTAWNMRRAEHAAAASAGT